MNLCLFSRQRKTVMRHVAAALMLGAILPAPAAMAGMDAHFSQWRDDWPHRAVLTFKPGVDTRETVTAALGKPKAILNEKRVDVHADVRDSCETSVYQNSFDNVLSYQGRISFKYVIIPYKAEQNIKLYFDANGRLCAGDLLRVWTLPGAIAHVQRIFRDYPGTGWQGGEWRETSYTPR